MSILGVELKRENREPYVEALVSGPLVCSHRGRVCTVGLGPASHQVLSVSPHHSTATQDSEQSGDTAGETRKKGGLCQPVGACHIVEKMV